MYRCLVWVYSPRHTIKFCPPPESIFRILPLPNDFLSRFSSTEEISFIYFRAAGQQDFFARTNNRDGKCRKDDKASYTTEQEKRLVADIINENYMKLVNYAWRLPCNGGVLNDAVDVRNGL